VCTIAAWLLLFLWNSTNVHVKLMFIRIIFYKGKIIKVGNPVYVVHSLLLMKPQPESGLFNFPCAIDYSSI